MHYARILICLITILSLMSMMADNVYPSEAIGDGNGRLTQHEKLKIVELKGDEEVCRWVSNHFDSASGVLEGQYQWEDVSADLLEAPNEYFGHIKHLEIDIDNDGENEYLVKVASYLGGTLSATELVVSQTSFLFETPISVKTLFGHASYSLKTDGKKAFSASLNRMKQSGVEVVSSPDLLYGYSVYELQHNISEVFEYEGKNYILLNSFVNPHAEKIGLVVRLGKDDKGDFYNTDICLFRNQE